MAKRVANKQLNQDNWELDDPVEEAGIFEKANDEEIGKRIIRKAKRANVQKDDSINKPGLFSSFTGFTAKTDNSETSVQLRKFATKPLTNGSTSDVSHSVQTSSSGDPQGQNSLQNSEYYFQLKALNECFLGWVQKYVASSPFCDFTPVFRDYENYVKDIERRFKNPASVKTSSIATTDSPFKLPMKADNTSTPNSFKIDTNTVSTTDNKLPVSSSQFKFDSGVNSKPSAGLFTFGSANAQVASSAPLPGFFKPSQTSSGTGELSTTDKEDSDPAEQSEDTYEPPKNDIIVVEESDAVYSKRCKLFFKKDGAFSEKGCVTLHLKPLSDDKEKVQLLIRAETVIGNILVNIRLSSSIPISRVGKNNVLLCVPNLLLDPKSDSSDPTSILLRVKTAEDADKLADTLKSYRS